MLKGIGTALAVAGVTLSFAGSASAQDAAPTAAAADVGGSDHAAMSGRLGIGYLGRRGVPIATGDPAAGTFGTAEVPAPVIGVRYWLDDFLGIDAGLGFASVGGGETETDVGGNSTTVDKAARTAFLLHGGVPLSLASSGHFSFQVVPELNVGFASSEQEVDGADNLEFSGFLLDVGARAGAEVHFGFIDIPELSLQAGVGFLFRMSSVGVKQGDAEITDSTTDITTTVNENPWNIFTSNVSALYYF